MACVCAHARRASSASQRKSARVAPASCRVKAETPAQPGALLLKRSHVAVHTGQAHACCPRDGEASKGPHLALPDCEVHAAQDLGSCLRHCGLQVPHFQQYLPGCPDRGRPAPVPAAVPACTSIEIAVVRMPQICRGQGLRRSAGLPISVLCCVQVCARDLAGSAPVLQQDLCSGPPEGRSSKRCCVTATVQVALLHRAGLFDGPVSQCWCARSPLDQVVRKICRPTDFIQKIWATYPAAVARSYHVPRSQVNHLVMHWRNFCPRCHDR
jgi:hypothetical protein